jgi:hypothetical protein
MDTVIVVLKVGLILYAIYSFIVYATRRSGNKSALKDFRARPCCAASPTKRNPRCNPS